jgi:hypothetical protein
VLFLLDNNNYTAKCLNSIADLYNWSPFGKRNGNFLTVIEILIKLVGMHSDHCVKEKKDAKLMKDKKMKAVYQSIGEEELIGISNEELKFEIIKAENQKIKAAGGKAKWHKLSDEEKKERTAAIIKSLIIKLGKEAYAMMSDDEKGTMKFCIWAGCGCHKDLDTVKGGYAAMKTWWTENNVEPPVLLANRDNAAVFAELPERNDTVIPAQQQAIEKPLVVLLQLYRLLVQSWTTNMMKRGTMMCFVGGSMSIINLLLLYLIIPILDSSHTAMLQLYSY